MDLMALVPENFLAGSTSERTPIIVHNCEVTENPDFLNLSTGDRYVSKIRLWFLRMRILSRKHPLTRWCLKSTTMENYEIARHLNTHPYMIHPFSSFRLMAYPQKIFHRIVWETIMAVFTFVALLITPFHVVFYFEDHHHWHGLDYLIDTIFITDIVIWFFTGYYDYRTKIVVLDPSIVATKYLKGSFVIDTIPVLPLEALVHFSDYLWFCKSLNMLKILRIRTIIVYGRRIRYIYKISFQHYKMLEMAVIMIIFVHWAACLEYYVALITSKIFGKNSESWIENPYFKKKTMRITRYLMCVSRATIALGSAAHYLDMKSPEDIILNLILTVMGFLGLVYILLQFSELLTTFHSTSKAHLKLIQQLQEYMRHKELPQSLQRRLLIYYNYCNKKGFERDKQILKQVSPYLREELILHNYLGVVNTIEIFQHLPKTVVSQLVTSLRSLVFMANDAIVKAGTKGDALYFIASGTVSVYTASDKEVCHLEDGAYFGEVALVVESEHRIATVIAIETCEIYVLQRSDFQRAIAPYPELLKRLQNIILDHLDNTLMLEDAYNLKSSVTPKNINISSIKAKRKE